MKTIFYFRLFTIVILLLVCFSFVSFAQTDTTWAIQRNIADSTGWMHIDSIRARVIHVGDSSFVIGGTPLTGSDVIQTTNAGGTILMEPFNGITSFPGSVSVTPKVGIGLTSPQTALHLYGPNIFGSPAAVYELFTNNGNTGNTNGLQIGIASDGIAELRQNQNFQMNFYTNAIQRMTILANGNVGIGASVPLNILHMGTNAHNSAGDGWRSWMGLGTFLMDDGTFARTGTPEPVRDDDAFFGLRIDEDADPVNNDRDDAVICWGDNYSGTGGYPPGPDLLRIIFVGSNGSSTDEGGGTNGLEVSRYLPNGFVGIGNFSSTPNALIAPPIRRLEVLDGYNSANAHLDSPQLRLTYTQNEDVNKGIHTDFQTTSDGMLFLTPANSTHSPVTYPDYKWVGIDWPQIGASTDFNADLALDVNGQTNLRTVNNQDTLARVLVWDYTNNGNVKWRRASTLGGGISPCIGVAPGDLNYVTKWTNTTTFPYKVCSSQIYDDGIHVSIGYGSTYGPQIPFSSAGFAISYIGDANNISYGIYSTDVASYASYKFGIHGVTAGASVASVGVQGRALEGGTNPTSPSNIGGHFDSQGGTTVYSLTYPTGIIGVYGSARGGSVNYGVYGSTNGNQPTNYAGYFAGDVMTTSKQYYTSDSILKLEVQNFTGDSALLYIRNLKPKTYQFDNETYSYMNLPNNWQYGLIAQDVNRVLPNLVKQSIFPAEYDSTGTLIHDSVVYCGLDYTTLIPILVAGVKQLDSLQNNLPNQVNNALSVDTSTHKLQWGGSPLKHTTEIPMVDTTGGIDSVYNIYFSGQSHNAFANRGNVGIGFNKGDILPAKLNVLDSIQSGFISSDFGYGSCGFFHITGTPSEVPPEYDAVVGLSDVLGGETSIGGDFVGRGSGTNIGVSGYADDGASSSPTSATGVNGAADGTGSNQGVSAYAANGIYMNAGIYSFVSAVSGASNMAIYGRLYGGSPGDYAGYFDGDVYTTGSYLPSDLKLKSNIQDVSGASAIGIINSLKPKTYTYNTQQFPTMSLPTEQQYGLISEDVEQVLPTLVKDSKTPPQLDSARKKIIAPSIEFKALNYTALVPILIAATKQLDSTNAVQQSKIDSLQAQLAQINTALQQLQNCCAQNNSGTQSGDRQESVVLTNTNAIILDQNAPNPFAEQTTIIYTIPESVSNAQLIFSDIAGNVIKTVQIQTRGAGSLLVYASNLSSGLYTYSLIADGKLIDTKKMTIQK